jgi:2-succinyl-6-hydroxy-2,4-cyclohexadiene-1-carboxylate synthase
LTNQREMIEVRGIRYHVEISGLGQPLVLLHGFTGSAANWAVVRPYFELHFKTTAVDLLGHGQTDSPDDPQRYSIEQAADDLNTLLTALQPNQPAHLLGYSMGGRLALYTALTYPTLIRTLVLESASPGLKSEAERTARRAHDQQLAAKIEAEGLQAFVDDWTNQPLFATQPDTVRNRLRAQRLQNNPAGLASSLRGMGTGVQPSLWERLGELTCPTVLITGEHDAKYAAIAQEMQPMIPDCKTVVVPGAGHSVHAEQPDIYVQTVLEYLLAYT